MYSTGTGDVNLNVGMNTEPAKKNALQLAKDIVNTFKQTDSQINKTSSSMMSLENRIQKTSDKLQALRDKQTKLAQTKTPTEQYEALSKTITRLEGQLESLGAKSIKLQNGPQTNKTQQQLEGIEKEADRLQSSITYTEEAMQKLVAEGKAFTMGSDSAEYAKVTQQIAYTENEMDILNSKHDEMIAKQNKEVSIADRLKSSFNGIKGVVQKGVAGAFNKLRKVAHNSLNNVNKQTKKSIWTLMKYGLGIRSLYVLFRKLRGYATEAFKAMGQKFPEVQKDLNDLKNSFSTFKASIGTAFQPLLAAAVKPLTTIINLATKAANAIGSLFAALTGQNYVYKATAANNDYADSVSGVGKAAKEANKQLGQYDELMVIQQDTNSSGGGGTSGADSGMNWEKVPVDDSIQDLAKRIKDAWEKADFFDIGEEIGTKIKDKLDNIKWDKLKDSADKAGKSLATFLNGFFQSGVLASTGTAISEALNTAVIGALGFVNNFEWGDNGVEFGKMFNNLVTYFDEHKFAELIANTIKGALDFVIEFLTEADFNKLGQKIGSFLSDLTMEIPELTVKIVKLAWTIAKDAAGFVAGVNETNPFLIDLLACLGILKVASLGFTIPNIVVYATIAKIGWDLGNTIYENLDKDETGQNIIDKFVEATGLGDLAVNITSVFDNIDPTAGLFDKIKTGLSGIGNSIKQWVTDYIVNPWKEALGIGQGASGGGGGGPKKDGESFIQKFKDGVTNAVSNIKEWFNNTVIVPIQNKWDEIKNTFDLNISIPDIKAKIEEKWNAFTTWWADKTLNIKESIPDIKAKIEEKWNKLKEWWDNRPKLSIKLSTPNIKAWMKTRWKQFKEWWDTKRKNPSFSISVPNLKEKMKEKWKEFKGWWDSVIQDLKLHIKLPKISVSLEKQEEKGLGKWWNKVGGKPKFSVSWLAKGGVIPPNKEFMAILGDQKQGTNIETPLETMVQAFNMALDRRGGDSSSNHEPIVLQLDGRTVAKVVWDENQKRYKQTGRYSPAY